MASLFKIPGHTTMSVAFGLFHVYSAGQAHVVAYLTKTLHMTVLGNHVTLNTPEDALTLK